MSTPSRDENVHLAARRTRQRHILVTLAVVLIAGGLAVVVMLKRLPLPMRILVGLTDVFAGLGLLVLVRQKFGK